jgi:hypothetical protein
VLVKYHIFLKSKGIWILVSGLTNIKLDNVTKTWIMVSLNNGRDEIVGTCSNCKTPFGVKLWNMTKFCEVKSIFKLTKVIVIKNVMLSLFISMDLKLIRKNYNNSRKHQKMCFYVWVLVIKQGLLSYLFGLFLLPT